MDAVEAIAQAEPVVSPKRAREILDIGTTKLYELLDSRQLRSYLDGKSRKIFLSSIGEYQRRRMSAEAA